MNGSFRKFGITGMAIVALLAGVVFIAGCGGSDDSGPDSTSSDQAAAGGPGGMFASLTDDQQQCLEDAGVTLPQGPDGQGQPPEGMTPPDGSGGTPPEGMTPPDGAPQSGSTGSPGVMPQGVPEAMEELQSAMEECGIELPDPPGGGQTPPDGGQAPSGQQSSGSSDLPPLETQAS